MFLDDFFFQKGKFYKYNIIIFSSMTYREQTTVHGVHVSLWLKNTSKQLSSGHKTVLLLHVDNWNHKSCELTWFDKNTTKDGGRHQHNSGYELFGLF